MDTAKLCDYSRQADICLGPKDNLDLMVYTRRSHYRFLAGVYMISFIFRIKSGEPVRVQSGDQNHNSNLNRESETSH